MPKSSTFEDVIKRIETISDDSDLVAWFRIITEFYLTDKDLVILEAQKAQIESNARQRVLSVLYCVTQPYLSVKLRKLRTKIVTLHGFLRNDSFVEEYFRVKSLLSPNQYRLLSYAMAGCTQKEISQIIGTTHVNAIICVNAAKTKIDNHRREFPILSAYLAKYKKNFV